MRSAKDASNSNASKGLVDELSLDLAKLAKNLADATGSLPSHDRRGYESVRKLRLARKDDRAAESQALVASQIS